MKRLLALALLAAPVPAASATVEVANGNWSQLPPLDFRGPDHLSTKVMQRLFEISSDRQCRLAASRATSSTSTCRSRRISSPTERSPASSCLASIVPKPKG